MFLIQVYRLFLSPFLGGRCNYYPSCSEYANEAFRVHGFKKGLVITFKRVSSCHPFGKRGYDPVISKRKLNG